MRALVPIAAALAVAAPLSAQPPEGCWGIVMSDWEWTVYQGDAGEPTYPPSESAVRFVPEVFRMTDSTVVEATRFQSPWYDVVAVLPARDQRPGYWQDRPQSSGGMRITWSEVGLFFEAVFPTFATGRDSIPGYGYEEPEPTRTHHGIPSWRGSAVLVKRECSSAGVL